MFLLLYAMYLIPALLISAVLFLLAVLLLWLIP
jgi:hypothetical protein